MLDLIAFASAIALTKYISQSHPLLGPAAPPPPGAGAARAADARRDAPLRGAARRLSCGCLLVSLLLYRTFAPPSESRRRGL